MSCDERTAARSFKTLRHNEQFGKTPEHAAAPELGDAKPEQGHHRA